MKHFEAIKLIVKRIEDLRSEIIKLELLSKEHRSFSGYIFYKEDISNMLKEIGNLNETLKSFINN